MHDGGDAAAVGGEAGFGGQVDEVRVEELVDEGVVGVLLDGEDDAVHEGDVGLVLGGEGRRRDGGGGVGGHGCAELWFGFRSGWVVEGLYRSG